jgi:pilus assembly protein TadC
MKLFLGLAQKLNKFFPNLKLNLLYAGIKKSPREYIADALQKSTITFITLLVLIIALFIVLNITIYFAGILIVLVISMFFFTRIMLKPSLVARTRIRNLEKNLLPALQSIYVQINSGISLFEVLTNISKAGYGEVSKEFDKAVSKINAGRSQLESLEELIMENPSIFFRRALWQIINGMKAGADLSNTIEQAVGLLAEEKLIQIQNYGSRLSPMAMLYMLVGMILPALSVIFIILLTSFANLPGETVKGIFVAFYVFVFLFQFLFIGIINSRRPSLI